MKYAKITATYLFNKGLIFTILIKVIRKILLKYHKAPQMFSYMYDTYRPLNMNVMEILLVCFCIATLYNQCFCLVCLTFACLKCAFLLCPMWALSCMWLSKVCLTWMSYILSCMSTCSFLVCHGALSLSKVRLSCFFKMVFCKQGALFSYVQDTSVLDQGALFFCPRRGIGFMFFLALRSIHTVLLRFDLTCSETIRIHATSLRHWITPETDKKRWL